MNLILDWGFETGAPWTLSGDASLQPGEGISGSQALYLWGGQLPTGIGTWGRMITGTAWQPTTVKAGTVYPVVFWHRQVADSPFAAGLQCVERTADGTLIPIVTVQTITANTDWQIGSALWTPTEDNAGFGFYTPGQTRELPHYFFVDNAEVEQPTMARGLQVCYKALYDALKGINGSSGSYNYDLENRVIPRLILPDEPGAPKMPYICIPMGDTGPFLEQGERALRVALRQQIIAFLPESYEDEITDSSGYKAQLMSNDIQRCLWPAVDGTWDLNTSGVEDVQFLNKEIVAGQPDDLPFSSATITVDVITRYGRDDLAA